MIRLLKASSLLAILLCISFKTAPSLAFTAKINKKLENAVQEVIDTYSIPGANVGIWIENKGHWEGSFGVSNKETQAKMDLNMHFRIGSITKTFVATAVLKLVDEGKLSLDDKISKFINDVPNGDKISIRDLGGMTSGLASYTENDIWAKQMIDDTQKQWTSEELWEASQDMPTHFEPGKKFNYSNTNTLLLGMVIEQITGMSLGDHLKESIFKPLNLNNTYFPTDELIPEPYAHGYTRQTLDNSEEEATNRNPSWGYAAGQLISTLNDLRIWAEALGTGKLLSKKSFKEMQKWTAMREGTDEVRYGFGVAFNKGWLLHGGGLPGYNSMVAYLPGSKAAFVCLVNSDIAVKIDGEDIVPVMPIFRAVAKISTPKVVPLPR